MDTVDTDDYYGNADEDDDLSNEDLNIYYPGVHNRWESVIFSCTLIFFFFRIGPGINIIFILHFYKSWLLTTIKKFKI